MNPNKPKFDPNKPFTIVDEKPKFDPSRPYTAVEDATEIDSALRGAAQGASFGFADEITGGLESLFTDKSYEQARDESRANYKAAENANPKSYMTGEIGGAIASSFIPGLGLAKGATLAANVGKMGAIGAATGLGMSDADLTKGDYLGAAKDTAIGFALGAGSEYGLSKAGPLVEKAIDKYPPMKSSIKGLGKLVGVNTEAIDHYYKRPDAVKNANTVSEIADSVLNLNNKESDLSLLYEKLKGLSNDSWKSLDDKASPLSKAEFKQAIDDYQNSLKIGNAIPSSNKQKAFNALEGLKERIEPLGDNWNQVDSKKLIQQIDSDINWNSPDYKETNEALKSIRDFTDSRLKKQNPVYDKRVSDEADFIQGIENVKKYLSNRLNPDDYTKFERAMKSVLRGKEPDNLNPVNKAFDFIKEHAKTDNIELLKDAWTKDQFEKQITNGSRNTFLGNAIGQIGGVGGSITGALTGYAADKFGPKTVQRLADVNMLINKVPSKFRKPLLEAQKRGTDSLLATHLLLMKNEEYKKAVEE